MLMPALSQLRPLNPMMSPALISASPGSTILRLNGNIADLPARLNRCVDVGDPPLVVAGLIGGPAIFAATLVEHRRRGATDFAPDESHSASASELPAFWTVARIRTVMLSTICS